MPSELAKVIPLYQPKAPPSGYVVGRAAPMEQLPSNGVVGVIGTLRIPPAGFIGGLPPEEDDELPPSAA